MPFMSSSVTMFQSLSLFHSHVRSWFGHGGVTGVSLQNGQEDSGRSNGGIHWQEPVNVNRTIKDLGMIANLSLAVNAAAK